MCTRRRCKSGAISGATTANPKPTAPSVLIVTALTVFGYSNLSVTVEQNSFERTYKPISQYPLSKSQRRRIRNAICL
jgi:hypothetical protein